MLHAMTHNTQESQEHANANCHPSCAAESTISSCPTPPPFLFDDELSLPELSLVDGIVDIMPSGNDSLLPESFNITDNNNAAIASSLYEPTITLLDSPPFALNKNSTKAAARQHSAPIQPHLGHAVRKTFTCSEPNCPQSSTRMNRNDWLSHQVSSHGLKNICLLCKHNTRSNNKLTRMRSLKNHLNRIHRKEHQLDEHDIETLYSLHRYAFDMFSKAKSTSAECKFNAIADQWLVKKGPTSFLLH